MKINFLLDGDIVLSWDKRCIGRHQPSLHPTIAMWAARKKYKLQQKSLLWIINLQNDNENMSCNSLLYAQKKSNLHNLDLYGQRHTLNLYGFCNSKFVNSKGDWRSLFFFSFFNRKNDRGFTSTQCTISN